MATVFGRRRELSQAASFLERATERLTVLALEGEAGIGKTTVWEEVARGAEARGFRVLAARPAEAEARVSLAAVADLFGEVTDEELAVLSPPQRHALDVALFRTGPGDAPLDRRALATAVRLLLAALASRQPTLVAVDDVQWLDGPSAFVLEFALRRLADEPLGVLLARRHGQPGGLAAERLVRPDSLVRATIGPLTLAGLHQLLAERLERPLPRAALVRVEQASAGNPLLALEVGRLLVEHGLPAPGEPLPVPPDVGALVGRRIARLPAPTREVLLVVACLADASTEAVSGALGRPIEDDLEPAERAGLVTCRSQRIAFVHPLFAAAVVSSAPAAERRRAHGKLAVAVAALEERARHLALATEGRDERVATIVHDAAREALFRGAPLAAAELVELALAVGEPDSDAQRRRVIDLADYVNAAGDTVRAFRLLAGIESWDGWPAGLQADAMSRLGAFVSAALAPAATTAFLEQLLVSADGVSPRVAVETALSFSTSDYDVARAARHADAALTLLGDAAVDPGIRATALYARLRTDVLRGAGLDLELAGRIEHLEARLPPDRRFGRTSAELAFWFKHVDDLATSRTRLERSLEQAVDSGDEPGQLAAHVHLAITECWAGNLRLARRHAAAGLEMSYQLDSDQLYEGGVLALVEAHLGNVGAVRELAARFTGAVPATRHEIRLNAALGLVELSLGNPAAASRHLRGGLEAAIRTGCAEPGLYRIHADAAEAEVALGELGRADDIADFLERHGERTGRSSSSATAARVRALAAAARGDIGAALAEAERAVERHAGLPMPFERARTLVVKGSIERRARKRRQAKESFEEALAAFEAMGARLWVERARRELERVGMRQRGPDELTESELRVAELAADGLTNRAVANAAFMSPKTVEANLARVYRKLGIRSRAELGARMRDRPPRT